MEVAIRNNRISVKNVNLGKKFSDISGDLLIDQHGQVKVTTDTKLTFITDIHSISPRIFSEMNDVIGFEKLLKDNGDTKLSKIIRKMMDITDLKIINTI